MEPNRIERAKSESIGCFQVWECPPPPHMPVDSSCISAHTDRFLNFSWLHGSVLTLWQVYIPTDFMGQCSLCDKYMPTVFLGQCLLCDTSKGLKPTDFMGQCSHLISLCQLTSWVSAHSQISICPLTSWVSANSVISMTTDFNCQCLLSNKSICQVTSWVSAHCNKSICQVTSLVSAHCKKSICQVISWVSAHSLISLYANWLHGSVVTVISLCAN